jgi:uncharacterized membrane protein
MALALGTLLTIYVTTSYTSYIRKIDDLEGLEIIEVTYGRLAAGGGMIWLRVRLWVSVLEIEIRNSFNFLWFFFFAFRCYRYNRGYWLLLKFVDMSEGIVNLKYKVMDLLLEELDNRVTLSDYYITLIDLILLMDNDLISFFNNFLLFRDQCLKLLYLSDLSISISVVILSYTGQQIHTVAQYNLIVVLGIHEPDGATKHLFG